ncbi:plasma kallikrein isoform X1 [Hydra vulgaris]|uniref:plasma kallikrein isoform X1 n=1 Tax=Hydra vulgaris TaxID=6087 RepID=UPI0006415EAA
MSCVTFIRPFLFCLLFVCVPLESKLKKKCEEVQTFITNPCEFQVFRKKCADLCNFGQTKLNCGRNKKERKRRIVGGTASKRGEWPWHVSLNFNGKQWCSGAILSKSYILTAAHCFDPIFTSSNASHWQVYTGDYLLYEKDLFEKAHDIKRIIKHKEYKLIKNEMQNSSYVIVNNDIAILKLKTHIDLSYTSNEANICIPDKPASPDQTCNIVGWGFLKHNGVQPEVLQKAEVPIVSNNVCNEPEAYNKVIKEDYLLCAGYKNGKSDSCNYDSGGSLACLKDGLWHASGIVSSGFECARPHFYGLYTNVVNYQEWLLNSILN